MLSTSATHEGPPKTNLRVAPRSFVHLQFRSLVSKISQQQLWELLHQIHAKTAAQQGASTVVPEPVTQRAGLAGGFWKTLLIWRLTPNWRTVWCTKTILPTNPHCRSRCLHDHAPIVYAQIRIFNIHTATNSDIPTPKPITVPNRAIKGTRLIANSSTD